MLDRDFLIWIHERLEHVHDESPTVGHMHKLRAVIRATDGKQQTPNMGTGNCLQDVIGGLDS